MTTLGKWLCLLLLLSGCSAPTEHWVWQHPEGYGADRLSADTDACEEIAKQNRQNEGFVMPSPDTRPRGDWGSFEFEQCMQELGWKLVLEPLPKGEK